MFDLISGEYGWSDRRIGRLTVRRFRQIVAAISLRRTLEAQETRTLLSWQTRQLVTFVAATGFSSSQKTLDAARLVAFDADEVERLEALQKLPPGVGEGRSNARENSPGSYEFLMGSPMARGKT